MAPSRRSAGDINILAMLDGLGTRPRARRHLVWYGAGGVLVCGLIGTLVWLAHEPGARLDSSMVADAEAKAPALPIEHLAGTPAAPAAPQPPAGATIVSVADAPSPAAPELAIATRPVPAAPPLPILPAPASALALHAPAPKTLDAHRLPVRAAASAHPDAVHAKRNAPLAKPVPAPAAIDTDVALISAIIQHAATQHDDAQEGCAGKSCGPHMPARP